MTRTPRSLVGVLSVLTAGAALAANGPVAGGGLVVVAGCDDPWFIAGLRTGKSRVVQALDTDPAKVTRVRAHLTRGGLYGSASARTFDGEHLPFVDGLVNLYVQRPPFRLDAAEITRVLAPGGSAIEPDGTVIVRKPRPKEIDEWTHFLHGPDNNAVAKDSRIGPPRHLQWLGGPMWARHHDRMASLSAAVSASGRLFYIMDEGPKASALTLPDWKLTARDAFNGITLWKRSIADWYPHLWPLKSGPAWLPRRLVAAGDHVYVTLRLHAPVTQIDAATGGTVRTYNGTDSAGEILFHDGLLLVTVDESKKVSVYKPRVGVGMKTAGIERDMAAKNYPWDWTPKRVVAIRAGTGTTLWQKRCPVAPLTLSMNGRYVFLHNGEEIVCLSRSDGQERWRTAPGSQLQGSPRNWYAKTVRNIGRLGKALPASFAPTLVLHEGVVIFSGGDGKLCGLDQDSGEQLWIGECLASGHYTPEDVLVAGGLVWTTEIAHGNSSGRVTGLDPITGKLERTIACNAKIYWFHQRCYRSKATERYLLTGRAGIEYIDLETGRWTPHHWVRGGCLYGILPCNGLVYTPPHNCACYIEAKLFGFNALAAERTPIGHGGPPRLGKGPAHARSTQLAGGSTPRASWPTYRHDNRRSGCASGAIGASLREAWRANFPARVSQPTIAGGKALVAVPDLHAVVCIDAATGKEGWRFAADGRVDSPPTIFGGLCVFGSADGHVYCLTMDEGELVWRFGAAATDRSLVAFGQVESVWPVPGSVLVRGEEVMCVTGRSVFLDGGLRMIRLNARTGTLLAEHAMGDEDPERPGTGFQYRLKGLSMPVGLPDILSCDGERVYMRSQKFDLEGRRVGLGPVPSTAGGGRHIFSPTGFLDASWMHRSYWVYGTGFDEGAGGWPKAGKVVPAGRILCHDSKSVYGYGRTSKYYQWSTPLEYHLFAAAKNPATGKKGRSASRVSYRWSRETKLHVTSIVVAGDILLVAGPPSLMDEVNAFRDPFSERSRAKMKDQADAFCGERGGLLKAVATSTGGDIAEMTLDYLPAFDGMAVAEGKLFLTSDDGVLVCYEAR